MPYKRFACNEVATFQVSTLLKVSFFTFYIFVNRFRNAYFKEQILRAASTIYFFNLFVLSCKRVSKTVGLLRKFQNVLSRASKFLRFHLDYGGNMH